MDDQSITPNETIQLHEILTFKNICLTKAITMAPLISDVELKSILQQKGTILQTEIEELRTLMERSNIATSANMES